MATHSAYNMFSLYIKYLIVDLVFSNLGFGVGISFRLCYFLIVAYFYFHIKRALFGKVDRACRYQSGNHTFSFSVQHVTTGYAGLNCYCTHVIECFD